MQRLFTRSSSSPSLLARLNHPAFHAHQRLNIISSPLHRRPFPNSNSANLPPSYLLHHKSAMSTSTSANDGAAETDKQAQTVANTSGITTESLRRTIVEKLEAKEVDIEDMSGGCGQSFQAIIISPLFEKKNSLARHRLVNSALKTEIAAIHAWTPKCFTPEEWEKKQSQ